MTMIVARAVGGQKEGILHDEIFFFSQCLFFLLDPLYRRIGPNSFAALLLCVLSRIPGSLAATQHSLNAVVTISWIMAARLW
jgi:hypothetical protein